MRNGFTQDGLTDPARQFSVLIDSAGPHCDPAPSAVPGRSRRVT
jgi:hypothetical protein